MPQISQDKWIPRFAKKLRQLQPSVDGDDAMELALAEATYPEACDFTPEEAAEIYALEESPDGAAHRETDDELENRERPDTQSRGGV